MLDCLDRGCLDERGCLLAVGLGSSFIEVGLVIFNEAGVVSFAGLDVGVFGDLAEGCVEVGLGCAEVELSCGFGVDCCLAIPLGCCFEAWPASFVLELFCLVRLACFVRVWLDCGEVGLGSLEPEPGDLGEVGLSTGILDCLTVGLRTLSPNDCPSTVRLDCLTTMGLNIFSLVAPACNLSFFPLGTLCKATGIFPVLAAPLFISSSTCSVLSSRVFR